MQNKGAWVAWETRGVMWEVTCQQQEDQQVLQTRPTFLVCCILVYLLTLLTNYNHTYLFIPLVKQNLLKDSSMYTILADHFCIFFFEKMFSSFRQHFRHKNVPSMDKNIDLRSNSWTTNFSFKMNKNVLQTSQLKY